MLQPEISDDDVRNAAMALMEPKEEKKPRKRAGEIIAERKTFHSEVFNALSHKNRAKAIYRQMDIELLKWTKEQLDEILADKEKALQAQKEKEQNRHKVIEQLNELLQANGTTLKELYPEAVISEPEKKRGPYKKSGKPRLRTYKFKCHIFDRDYYWAGSGYIPTAFRCHLAKGHTIDSCYLPEDQWLKTHEKVDQIIPGKFQNTAEKLINEANKQKIAKTRSELSFHD